ncbi:hypothetical protein MRX96_046751 [Rhipicephalus microplus]
MDLEHPSDAPTDARSYDKVSTGADPSAPACFTTPKAQDASLVKTLGVDFDMGPRGRFNTCRWHPGALLGHQGDLPSPRPTIHPPSTHSCIFVHERYSHLQ